MTQPLNPSSYFSAKANLKKREEELHRQLMERLPSSQVATLLFEYLVIRSEIEKNRLSKELDSTCQGRLKELDTLLNLFYVKVE